MQTETWDLPLQSGLAGALSMLPLAPARRASLRARVLATAAPRPSGATLREEGSWYGILPGIEVKILRQDHHTQSALWRLNPGARIPAHAHEHEEECLVVDGLLEYAGRRFGAGDYLQAEAGQAQSEIHAPGGAMLWIRGERRV